MARQDMSDIAGGSALDVRELLLLIAEQQASLVNLQQLVVAHVLSESEPGPWTVNTPLAPAASDAVAAIDASNVVSPAQEAPSDTDVVRSPEPEPIPAARAPLQLKAAQLYPMTRSDKSSGYSCGAKPAARIPALLCAQSRLPYVSTAA